MTNAARIVADYWSFCDKRDWAAFAGLLSPDVVYDLPQTHERIRGRPRYVEFNQTYPGDWRVEVVRITGDNQHAASWTRFVVGGEEVTGLCFFDLDEHGLIAHITDFWPEPYDPPPGREHLTERY